MIRTIFPAALSGVISTLSTHIQQRHTHEKKARTSKQEEACVLVSSHPFKQQETCPVSHSAIRPAFHMINMLHSQNACFDDRTGNAGWTAEYLAMEEILTMKCNA